MGGEGERRRAVLQRKSSLQQAQEQLNTVLTRRGSIQDAQAAAGTGGTRVVTKQPKYTGKQRLVAPVAGFCSAAIEITATWPLEYSKTQLQLNRTNPNFSIFKHLQEKKLSIYRGIAPMLIGAPLQGFLRFGCLDFFQNLFRDETTGKVSVAAGLCAGIGAGILESVLVVSVMETMKTVCIDSGKSLPEAARYVIKNEGLRGVYKGVGATVAKSASNQALRFMIFNQYKNMLVGDRAKKELSAGESLAGGCIAGLLGALGNTPFDVVKSRMQGLESKRYNNLGHCFITMIREEGFFSLYKGLLPRMGRVVPGQGIIFMSYGVISEHLYGVLDKQQ